MDASFPVVWGIYNDDGFGGPKVELSDAGTIYIDDCDDSGNGGVVGKTTLRQMVEYCVEGWRGRDGYTCEENEKASDAIAHALREAADILDAAKAPKPTAAQSHPA